MDLRFNILNNYVDKFIVSEATFLIVEMTKKLDLILIILKNLKKRLFMLLLKRNEIVMKKTTNSSLQRLNSIKRIEFQRNGILRGLRDADGYIIIVIMTKYQI